MEKKKLLLVAISVGVFLVITIGAALVFAPKNSAANSGASVNRPVPGGQTGITVPPPPSYSPPSVNGASSGTANTDNSRAVDAVELVRKPDEVPGLRHNPDESTQQDFYISGSSQSSGGTTVISVPRPSTAAVPESAPAGKAVAASRPAPAATPKPAAQSLAAAKPAPVKKPAAQTRVQDDYWVQTGAFSTLAKAEGIKESLASRGITSLIENRDINGNTIFRIRVGPYTSQNEADYWLSLIKSINGFEDSQVRQTRRQ